MIHFGPGIVFSTFGSDTPKVVRRRRIDSRWPVAALTAHSEARYWFRIAISAYPHLHSTPSLVGFSSEYCYAVWCGNTRMVWLPGGEKNLKIIRFDRMYERDRHTDGQTPHDDIGRACIAHSIARQKRSIRQRFRDRWPPVSFERPF